MTNSKSTVRTLIGAAAILVTSATLAMAYSNDTLVGRSGAAKVLPGTAVQLDPCGPGKASGPLGY